MINAHLRNKNEHGAEIVGIYPLLSDDSCLFLAVDFDEEKWKEDIATFRFFVTFGEGFIRYSKE